MMRFLCGRETGRVTLIFQTQKHLGSGPRWICASSTSFSSQKSSPGDGQLGPGGVAEPDPLQDESIGLVQRFKRSFKQYGKVMIPVHLVTTSIWFGAFYYSAMK